MKINVSDLKRLCEILLNKAEKAGFSEIDIDKDNYWLISADEREDFSIDNPNICVGSIADDIKGLQKILEGINIPTPVDFDRLANVLIALGERISRSDTIY